MRVDRLGAGFTLIEVIVVSVIVAVLAAASIPLYNGYLRDARINAAKNNCQLIGAAVMQAHVRGINIPPGGPGAVAGWTEIGLNQLSDNVWDYRFFSPIGNGGNYLGTANPDLNYSVTASGAPGGPVNGVTGVFLPYQPPASCWSVVIP